MYAFRCKHCGHLHTSNDAAEAPHPHACKVCGAGVTFGNQHSVLAREIIDPKLTQKQRTEMVKKFSQTATNKTVQPDNWEVLADATDERLKELGLTKADVEKHTPWKAGTTREPRSTFAVGVEGPQVKDEAK